jgi:ribosomal protein S6
MNEVNMPATEAVSHAHDGDIVTYELAYHVLPTVAEGEVTSVTDELKAILTEHHATITDEEAAERFELAYEIEKYLEGKYRRFASAYFGWIRFTAAADVVGEITTEVETHKKVLRSLTIRLNKVEEANPFRFHEAVVELKNRVTTIDTDAIIEDEVAIDTDEEAVAEAVVEPAVVAEEKTS